MLGFLHRAELFLIGDRIVELKVDELGLRYLMPTRGIMGQLVRQYGVYEEHIVNWTIDHFGGNPGGIFVDAGANVGWYTCLYGKLAGASGKVFAGPFSEIVKINNVEIFTAVGPGILNHLGHKSNPGSINAVRVMAYSRGTRSPISLALHPPKLKSLWIDLLKDVKAFICLYRTLNPDEARLLMKGIEVLFGFRGSGSRRSKFLKLDDLLLFREFRN